MNPPDLKYTKEHEWVRLEAGGIAVVGITEFAAESLGDVVFVDLPEVGAKLAQFAKMGEIESVKAVSDLYSPISGSVAERNERLLNHPELVNEGAYESGWMLRVRLSNPSELNKLMTAKQYEAHLASQEH